MVLTINSSSPASTLSRESIHRLYLFTGKGGVGKTTLALGLTQHLRRQKKKAFYAHLFNEKCPILKKIKVPTYPMDLQKFMEEYLGEKFHSKIIASWISRTPFVEALFNMLPGLLYLVLLGHLIKVLQKDPEMIIVLDSPATGHALTMLESPFNFKKILKSGVIADDIDRIQEFLTSPSLTQILICCVPNPMIMQEARELNEKLEQMGFLEKSLLVNNAFSAMPQYQVTDLPAFLKQKWLWQKEQIEKHQDYIKIIIPHLLNYQGLEIFKDLGPYLSELVAHD